VNWKIWTWPRQIRELKTRLENVQREHARLLEKHRHLETKHETFKKHRHAAQHL